LGSADEVPPRELLIFFQPAFRTGCKEDQKPVDEEQYLVVGNADAGKQGVERHGPILTVSGKTRQKIERHKSRTRYENASCFNKVAFDSAIPSVRYALHRIDQMLVEPGEKPESVFAGKILSIACMRAGDGKASGFSAEDTLLLKD
jgi:hypothetical protein